jgi:hypothetical protein
MQAVALCNVGYRFLSDIENGKQTVHIGKVLQNPLNTKNLHFKN